MQREPVLNSGRVLVGCQGWRYPDWRRAPDPPDLVTAPRVSPAGAETFADDLSAPFYSRSIKPANELAAYARTFPLVEVDSTFYSTPRSEWVSAWARATGPEFRFALKLPRILTHEYGLTRGRRSLMEFCAVAAHLEQKLAAILIQLPPSFAPDQMEVFKKFLPHLPANFPFAVEFRDPGWLSPATIELCARHSVSLMLGPTPWLGGAVRAELLRNLPGNFLYVRFMGIRDEMPFTHLQIDREAEMADWARAVREVAAGGRTVLALFDNHYQGYSPGSARLFAARLGIELGPFPRDQAIGDQPRLF